MGHPRAILSEGQLPLEYHPFIIEYDSGSAIGRDAVGLEAGWGKNPRKKSQGENCIQIERGFIYVGRVRRCLNMIEHDGGQAMSRIVKMTRRLRWDGTKKYYKLQGRQRTLKFAFRLPQDGEFGYMQFNSAPRRSKLGCYGPVRCHTTLRSDFE